MKENRRIEGIQKEILSLIFAYAVHSTADLWAIRTSSKLFRVVIDFTKNFFVSIQNERKDDSEWESLLKYLFYRSRVSKFSISFSNVKGHLLLRYLRNYHDLKLLCLSRCYCIDGSFVREILKQVGNDLAFLQISETSGLSIFPEINFSRLKVLSLTNSSLPEDDFSAFFDALDRDVTPNIETIFLGGLQVSIDSDFEEAFINSLPTLSCSKLTQLKTVEVTFVSSFIQRAIRKFFQKHDVVRNLIDFSTGDCTLIERCSKLFLQKSENAESYRTILAGATCCHRNGQNNSHKLNLLHFSVLSNNLPMIDWLTRMARTRCVDSYGPYRSTALFLAAQAGYTEIARTLLVSGADSSLRNRSFESPLYIAALRGNHLIVDMLICHHANECGRESATKSSLNPNAPVFIPGRGLVRDKTRMKLKYVEEEEKGDSEGFTPAHGACIRKSYESLHILIKANMNLELKTRNGQTPLMLSAWLGDKRNVQQLLAAGVNPNAKDHFGVTAYGYARKASNCEEIRQILLEAGCRPNDGSKRRSKREDRNQVGVN